MPDLNPWHPTIDTVELKTGLKFIEELGECQSAIARCLMQGVDEYHPVTGKPNREWLEDEIADVLANLALVGEFYRLDQRRLEERANQKFTALKTWHRMA